MIARLALLLILAMGASASAQDAVTPDIVMETTDLTDAATGESGPFPPGSGIDIVMRLRNRGDEAVNLRRIVLRASSALSVVDPVTDGLDNDDDGMVDEADEAFQRRDDDGVAWRLIGNGLRLEPGARLTRSVRVAVRDTALPGTSGVLSFSAGSTLSEGARSRPQRTLHLFPVPFTPPTLTLASNATAGIGLADDPILAAAIIIPGGVLSDAVVTLDLPPAMGGIEIKRMRIGTAIECSREEAPEIAAKTMILRLGRCRIDPTATARDRTVRFSLATTVTDVSPDASDAEIEDWRNLTATLALRNGDVRLGRTVMDAALHGPLVRVETALPAGKSYRPGDEVVATLRILNRGDEPYSEPRLRVTNNETFQCRSLSVGDDGTPKACDDGVLLQPRIEPGETLDITLRAMLRKDALIDADPGLELEIAGGEGPVSSSTSVVMAPHSAPRIAVADLGEWRKDVKVTTAAIGETARLRVSGTLPPGRYRGAVRLLARVIDARTGVPVAPAKLTAGRPKLSILTIDGSQVGQAVPMTQSSDTIWSYQVLPFDLRDEEESADEVRSFIASVDITLADDPALRSARLLEIVAESTAYGDSTVPGSEWIEVLITEPDLRLKLFSLDDDRVIHPGEALGIASLVCNYGDSPAFGTTLVVDLPTRIDPASGDTRKRAFTVPLKDVSVMDVADVLAEATVPEGSVLRTEASAVMLDIGDTALEPDRCVGIEVEGPLGPDRIAVSATVDVVGSLDSYAGSADPDRARRYPGMETPPLRFLAPAIRFGPSTTIQLGDDRRIAHLVELAVPSWLGPFRVSLSPESSSALDWGLFERGADGQLAQWLDGTAFSSGSTVEVVMRTSAPDRLPLGWVDTSRLRAVVLTEDGRSFVSTLRIVVRSGTGSARAIGTDKRVALDRDCDGSLADEHVQDAVFEPVKDASPGDCLIVRIAFENTGSKEVERIVIRDAISDRTTLLSGSPTVRIAPEPLDHMTPPDPARGILEWEFEGLFRPGAVGEVEYNLRLNPSPRKSLP